MLPTGSQNISANASGLAVWPAKIGNIYINDFLLYNNNIEL